MFFALIVILVGLAYFPSLSVPFYLDDYDSIANNPVIQSLDFNEISKWYSMREVGYLTLALDYQLYGTEVPGYHLSNIVIHLLVVCAVLFFTRTICAALKLSEKQTVYLSLVAAIIFAILPLNSQSVVYVIQRLAMLTALFYILGLGCYIKFRISDSNKVLWLLTTVVLFVLGLHTKQNIATFPIAILLIEILLLKELDPRRITGLLLAGLVGLFLLHLVDFVNGGKYVSLLDSASRETDFYTRWEYLTHQFFAIWMYISKFFYPFPLRLEYGWENLTWSSSLVWLGFGLTIAALSIAYKLRAKHPVIAFSILLYFVLHLVESSLIPIRDLSFEHRAYLPNVALTLLVAYLWSILFSRFKALVLLATCGVVLFFTYVTHDRVTLWGDPIEFYRHELRQEGENTRMYSGLAVKFLKKGDRVNATKWFKITFQVAEKLGRIQTGTVVAYIDLLNSQGKEGEAKYYGIKALELASRNQDKADLLAVMAKLDVAQGQCRDAMGMINRALRYHPENINANLLKKQCEQQLQVD